MAARGDYDGADYELHEMPARREPRIPDHPDTLAAEHEFARIHAATSDLSEARAEFEDVPSTTLTVREIDSLADRQNA
jgi:hypothetical protein